MTRRHRHVFDAFEGHKCVKCGEVATPDPQYDVLYPYAGACAFCGGPDKRHRLADAIRGEKQDADPKGTAESYGVTVEAVEALWATS